MSRPGHLKTVPGFALVIGLAIAVQIWAALQGTANFNADEAIWGLMSRHILQQRSIPTYFYGQQYLGTLEAVFSAFFLNWMGHSNLVALRIIPVLLFGSFLTLNGILVNRLWGKQVALLSLVVLAFPGWLILLSTFNSVCAYGTVLTLGTTTLLLLQTAAPQKQWLGYIGWLIFGFIVGLGVWIHPMTVVYFVSVALVYWLQTPEWSTLYKRAQGFCDRVIRIPLREFVPVVSLCLLGLGISAFFVSGCKPFASIAKIQNLSRVLLFLIGGWLMVMIFWVSAQRRRWLLRTLICGIGVALGNLPQWRAWLFSGVVPDSAVAPACPTGIPLRLQLLGKQLIPSMWGIPALNDLFHYHPIQVCLWISMFILAITAVGVFIWTERIALWSLVSLSPLSQTEGRAVTWGLLFGLPIVLVVLGGNVYHVYQVRYLIISWQTGSVILALFLIRLARKSKVLGLGLIGLWVVQVGIGNLTAIGQFWDTQRELYSPQAISAVEEFLTQQHVTGGYADYWTAYPLDFLTEERLIFAPYNGIDRYPAYSQKVANLPVQALLLPIGVISESSNIDNVTQALTVGTVGGPTFSEVLEWVSTQTVLQHRTIANWDVWVLTDDQ